MASTHIQRETAAAQMLQMRQQHAKETEAQRVEFHCTLPTGPKRKKPLVCDYIPLEFSQEYIDHLKKPDDLVIPGEGGITLLINYPLQTPAKFKIRPEEPRGFTRKDLAQTIIEIYQMVYQKEKETMTGEETLMSESSSNRAPSDGKYGIWGHFLGDLLLVEAIEDKALGMWLLIVES